MKKNVRKGKSRKLYKCHQSLSVDDVEWSEDRFANAFISGKIRFVKRGWVAGKSEGVK